MPKIEILDNEVEFKKIDRSGMLAVVAQMPEMIAQAERFAAGVNLPKINNCRQVIVAGMGGSAIAGDIAADIFYRQAAAPITTVRNYSLPGGVGQDSLFFAMSYSGNTEETLQAAKEAANKKAKVICITSGGKLKELAESQKYPLILIPTGLQPRAALPYLLTPLLLCLGKTGIGPLLDGEINEAVTLLTKLRDEWGLARAARVNPAKQLAKKIVGRVPFIFGASGTTGSVAYRFKTQLNENSKMTAVANVFPELDHNEIVNISLLKKETNNFALLVLRDEADNERIKKRIEITKSLVSRQIGAIEIAAQGRSQVAKLFSLILFADLVSVYLAVLQGIDPTPVEIITRLKKEMSR
ncbi:MAG: bifunctional phosphoglucose/phosphomannose isomerase [Candidatus Margulisbacteria bacterium]|nr:bifunctional phosphoglucose/phosphomannose isomerase [Candidatus Margulisiibacteriota bacterium]